jgi:hypothetical protein
VRQRKIFSSEKDGEGADVSQFYFSPFSLFPLDLNFASAVARCAHARAINRPGVGTADDQEKGDAADEAAKPSVSQEVRKEKEGPREKFFGQTWRIANSGREGAVASCQENLGLCVRVLFLKQLQVKRQHHRLFQISRSDRTEQRTLLNLAPSAEQKTVDPCSRTGLVRKCTRLVDN